MGSRAVMGMSGSVAADACAVAAVTEHGDWTVTVVGVEVLETQRVGWCAGVRVGAGGVVAPGLGGYGCGAALVVGCAVATLLACATSEVACLVALVLVGGAACLAGFG